MTTICSHPRLEGDADAQPTPLTEVLSTLMLNMDTYVKRGSVNANTATFKLRPDLDSVLDRLVAVENMDVYLQIRMDQTSIDPLVQIHWGILIPSAAPQLLIQLYPDWPTLGADKGPPIHKRNNALLHHTGIQISNKVDRLLLHPDRLTERYES